MEKESAVGLHTQWERARCPQREEPKRLEEKGVGGFITEFPRRRRDNDGDENDDTGEWEDDSWIFWIGGYDFAGAGGKGGCGGEIDA